MNTLNTVLIPLAECCLRVSLVAAATIGCVLLAGRRRPAARAALSTTGLVAILVLTLLAAVPLPGWWSWDPGALQRGSELPARGTQETTSREGAAVEDVAGEAPSLAADGAQLDLAAAARRLAGARPPATAARSAHWPIVLLVILAGGAACGVLRLGWSLATALRIGRNSHPVPDLHARLAEVARRLDCSIRISLRESAELHSAAAVGWPRAMIVLPIQWREWSCEELRGVLAHEAAHVARRDFLTRCAALLTGAVHFYHPLVRWLTRQVVLNQELSADELAARAAGGRRPYLQALSRLALREDDRSRSGSIAGLLPVFSGFLIRRIEMLQAMDGARHAKSHRWLKWGAGSLLAALAVAAAGLRGTAAPPAEELPTGTQAADAASATDASARETGPVDPGDVFRRTPIDPSVVVMPGLPPEQSLGQGAFAIRVAELFKRPGFRQTLRETLAPALADGEMHWYWKDMFDSTEAPDLGLEDIDYIVGNLQITLTPRDDGAMSGPEAAPGEESGRLMMGTRLVQIRLRKPVDWPQLERCLPKATREHHDGVTYLKMIVPQVGPVPVCVYPANDRTLVICHEDIVRRVIEQRSAVPAPPAWIGHWKAADGGLLTFLSPAPLAAYVTTVADLEELYLGGVFDKEQGGVETDERASAGTDLSAGNQAATGDRVDDGLGSRFRAMFNDSPCVAVGFDWADDSDLLNVKLHLACGTKTAPQEACDLLQKLLGPMRQAALNAKRGTIDVRLVQFLNSLSVTVSDASRPDARGVRIRGCDASAA